MKWEGRNFTGRQNSFQQAKHTQVQADLLQVWRGSLWYLRALDRGPLPQGTTLAQPDTLVPRTLKKKKFFVVVAAAIHLKLSHKLQTLSGREHLCSDLFLHSYLFLSYLVLFLYWCCKRTCLLVQFGHILYA